jgi:hypothetical protein
MEYIFWWIFALIIFTGLFLVWYYSRRKKSWLTPERIKYYRNQIQRTQDDSPTERIIQCDKILSHILRDYGYEWTVADQLRWNPRILRDIDETWRLHKLRNKLAHDLHDFHDSMLIREARNFERLLLDLL